MLEENHNKLLAQQIVFAYIRRFLYREKSWLAAPSMNDLEVMSYSEDAAGWCCHITTTGPRAWDTTHRIFEVSWSPITNLYGFAMYEMARLKSMTPQQMRDQLAFPMPYPK